MILIRNTLKIESLSRADHESSLECRGNNNNQTKYIASRLTLDLISKSNIILKQDCGYPTCILNKKNVLKIALIEAVEVQHFSLF